MVTDGAAEFDGLCAKPMRADAVRNRARILEAARETFAEEGLEAQMDAIARRAELGVGTLYRHFPTKAELISALTTDHFATLAALACARLDGGDEPWEALAGFLHDAAERQASDRALGEVLSASPKSAKAHAAVSEGLFTAMTELVERAQAAGTLRGDVMPEDLPMLLCAIGAGETAGPPSSSPRWPRMLALLLDGLRAQTGTPAALPPRDRFVAAGN